MTKRILAPTRARHLERELRLELGVELELEFELERKLEPRLKQELELHFRHAPELQAELSFRCASSQVIID